MHDKRLVEDKEIHDIAVECKRIAKKSQAVLDSLAVRVTARFPTLETGRVILGTLLEKEELISLTSSLERLEQRLRSHVSKTLER